MSIGLFKLRPRGLEQAITAFEVKKEFGKLPIKFFDNKGALISYIEKYNLQQHVPAESVVMAMFAHTITEIETHVNRSVFNIMPPQGSRYRYPIVVRSDGIAADGHTFSGEKPVALSLPPSLEAMMGIEAILYSKSAFNSDLHVVNLMREQGWIR